MSTNKDYCDFEFEPGRERISISAKTECWIQASQASIVMEFSCLKALEVHTIQPVQSRTTIDQLWRSLSA